MQTLTACMMSSTSCAVNISRWCCARKMEGRWEVSWATCSCSLQWRLDVNTVDLHRSTPDATSASLSLCNTGITQCLITVNIGSTNLTHACMMRTVIVEHVVIRCRHSTRWMTRALTTYNKLVQQTHKIIYWYSLKLTLSHSNIVNN